MNDFGRWLADTFRRENSKLVVGPIVWRVAIDREQVDVLIRLLTDIRGRLPTLEQRLRGLSTCETCEGNKVTRGVNVEVPFLCPACKGEGFAARKGEGF